MGLRNDNSSLRDCANQLKSEYNKLVEESAKLRHHAVSTGQTPVNKPNPLLSPIHSHPHSPNHQATTTGYNTIDCASPQMAAYRDIAIMQDEVTQLARENSELVVSLSKMRTAIETIRKEMEEEMQQ